MSKDKGVELYSAVERLVENPAKIIQRVEDFEASVEDEFPHLGDAQIVDETSRRLVEHYAKRTMVTGGASAVPGIFPGTGTLIALGPGNIADMTLCLKFEVELVLSLSALYGFDILDEHERMLAFLIASVQTYELESGKSSKNIVKDVVQTEVQAVWNYTPRQVGKIVASIFVKLALLAASRSFARALPIVGVAVSALGNRMLTRRVGEKAREALRYRVASEY